MPKQLVAVAPRKAALVDCEDPEIGRNQIRVKVEYASPKHGSEVGVFRGEDPFVADLFDEDWRLFLARKDAARDLDDGDGPVLGNQWVGDVVEKGDGVGRFGLGDRVCGYGGIRETQVIDAVEDPFLFRVPDAMPWKSALCLDPAQFALGGIRDGHIRLGDRVAVFGLGAIGAIAAQMARAAGAAYVAVVDLIQKRRDAAVGVGAHAAFDPLREDVGARAQKGHDQGRRRRGDRDQRKRAGAAAGAQGPRLRWHHRLRRVGRGPSAEPWSWAGRPTSTTPTSSSPAPAANPAGIIHAGTGCASRRAAGACSPRARSTARGS
jgi:threonine dehydrogenase-like Zn-dependent dehydrogenase